LGTAFLAFLVFQPAILGAWAALADGSPIMRLSIALPCVAVLLALAIVDEYPIRFIHRDFAPVIAAGLTVCLMSFALFKAFRRFTGFRLQWGPIPSPSNAHNYQFGLKYMLIVITFVAITLGFMGRAVYYRMVHGGVTDFEPDVIVLVLFVAGLVFVGAILPTSSIPLIILHGWPSNRAILISLTLYLVVTLPLLALFHRDMQAVFISQLGSLFAGALTALPLSLVGLRLVRDRPPRNFPIT
jgi:hypothetical protein